MEEALIQAELADPQTFVSRVLPVRGAMVRLARRFLRAEDAEDAVQVALLRAYTRRETFASPPDADPDAAIRGWLLRITFRVTASVSRGDVYYGLRIRALGAQESSLDCEVPVSNRGRHNFNDSAAFGDVGLLLLSEEQPAHEFEGAPRYSPEVEGALLALRAHFREVLLLVDSGLSYQQVAELVGVPIGTVMSRLYRAREALKVSLGGYALQQYRIASVDRSRKNGRQSKSAEVVESDADAVHRVVVVRRHRAL